MYPILSRPVRKAAKKSWKNPTIDNDGTRDSPNGTGLLSESPNSFGDSPRDRSYVHKDSYAHRIRDKDSQPPRERERPRDSDRRNTNDRGSTKENTQLVGDWTEHVTSSGKFFYYNCKLEFSQWEKPRDWVDWEKDEEKERYRRDRDRERRYHRQSSKYSSCGMNRIFILEFFRSVFVFYYKIYLSRLSHWCFFFLDEESKNSASDYNDDGDLPLTPASSLQVHQYKYILYVTKM